MQSINSFVLVALAASVALTACDSKDEISGPETRSNVRFVNATGDVTGLNFAVNGQATAQNVGFGPSAQCVQLNSGANTFTATRVVTNTAFGSSVNQNLSAAGEFTVLATGTAASPQWLVLNNTAPAATSGRARLRVVNAVPGATTSDVFVTAPSAQLGTAASTNLAFNNATTFLDVPAGQTQLRFTNTGTQTVTFSGEPFTVAAGQTSTVVVAPGTTAGTFRTIVVNPCS